MQSVMVGRGEERLRRGVHQAPLGRYSEWSYSGVMATANLPLL